MSNADFFFSSSHLLLCHYFVICVGCGKNVISGMQQNSVCRMSFNFRTFTVKSMKTGHLLWWIHFDEFTLMNIRDIISYTFFGRGILCGITRVGSIFYRAARRGEAKYGSYMGDTTQYTPSKECIKNLWSRQFLLINHKQLVKCTADLIYSAVL